MLQKYYNTCSCNGRNRLEWYLIYTQQIEKLFISKLLVFGAYIFCAVLVTKIVKQIQTELGLPSHRLILWAFATIISASTRTCQRWYLNIDNQADLHLTIRRYIEKIPLPSMQPYKTRTRKFLQPKGSQTATPCSRSM